MVTTLKENLKKKEFAQYDNTVINILDETTRTSPLIIRRALAEKALLERVPIRILEGELIAGIHMN